MASVVSLDPLVVQRMLKSTVQTTFHSERVQDMLDLVATEE